jgi:hypothetical protein
MTESRRHGSPARAAERTLLKEHIGVIGLIDDTTSAMKKEGKK